MAEMKSLGPEECGGLEPRMFAVNHAAGETLAPRIQKMLDPVRTDTFHCWVAAKSMATSLHYHDHDEYWAWAKGKTRLEIRLPDGRSDRFEIGPGWLVYCVRGVEHGHTPLEDWSCFEWVGTAREGIRSGHLKREF